MVNEWTADDLPPAPEAVTAYLRGRGPCTTTSDALSLPGVHAILDAVVDRLNAHHPKPPRCGHDAQIAQLVRMCNEADLKRTRAEDDVARLRRAHEIVEGERDQARDSLRSLRGAHSRLTRDYRHLSDRAEAAEARTAPAVSYDEILNAVHGNETGIYGLGQASAVADAVWSLVSGADPAVLVVRESDIAAVKVERDSHGEWFADGEHVYALGAADSRNLAGGYMQKAIRRLAVARAIEAEQDVDPVEDAAVAAFKAAWHRADEEGDEGNRVRRGIRAARDVLGQEASDDGS